METRRVVMGTFTPMTAPVIGQTATAIPSASSPTGLAPVSLQLLLQQRAATAPLPSVNLNPTPAINTTGYRFAPFSPTGPNPQAGVPGPTTTFTLVSKTPPPTTTLAPPAPVTAPKPPAPSPAPAPPVTPPPPVSSVPTVAPNAPVSPVGGGGSGALPYVLASDISGTSATPDGLTSTGASPTTGATSGDASPVASGLPSWVLPVALAVGAAWFFSKKEGKTRG